MNIQIILDHAIKINASDVHLSTNLPVYYRIDGQLRPLEKCANLKPKEIELMINSIISAEQKQELKKNKSIDFSYQTEKGARLRVNVFTQKSNLALAARIIRPEIPTMEEIGMPESTYQLTELMDGLLLVTGPTGCGKSTTLAAIINRINNQRACHIITLEDPVEFIFESKKSLIAQRELGRDVTSFELALKHVVRQDPDVILVGEMRDLETIKLAITLAETGHLVLATLHTLSAPQTIDRIIDIFPPHQQGQIRMQIALALKGIISQHLLPKIGGGRVAAREVLINTHGISNLIRENKVNQIKSLIQTGAEYGMITLEECLRGLYRDGKIDLEVAKAHANYPEEIIIEK